MTADDVALVMTCMACPEQYDAMDPDGNKIGYLRLRFGFFSVQCPDERGHTVYTACIGGEWEGEFPSDRLRSQHLAAARERIAAWVTTWTRAR